MTQLNKINGLINRLTRKIATQRKYIQIKGKANVREDYLQSYEDNLRLLQIAKQKRNELKNKPKP